MTAERQKAGLEAVLADEEAFSRWYERSAPRVFAYVFNRCGGATDVAEELTQQTFVEALRRRDGYDGSGDVVAWLCGIARHKLADHYRRLEREERRDRRLVVRDLTIDEGGWGAADTRLVVDAALRALPPQHRLVLLLRYLDRQGVPEIARTIGRSVEATESLLARARRSFARAYGEPSDDD